MEEELENPTEKNIENPEIVGNKQANRDEKGRFIEGVSGNPAGKPKGTKNFGTDFDEVVEEIAKLNNITFSEARKQLLKVAYVEAKKGNFNYSKDIFDRYYGKTKESVDVGGELIIKVINYGNNNSAQISTPSISAPDITEPSEIQGDSVAPQVREDEDNFKPAN